VFFPSSLTSPHALDIGMRNSLAESLAHIHTAAARHIGCGDVDMAGMLAQIRAHRVKPGLFGRYYDLVFAVRARRYNDAGTLFREIVALAAEQPVLTVAPFTEQALGTDKARYARMVDAETGVSAHLTAPASHQWLGFEEKVVAALTVIEEADAALASELRALVIEIVGAVPATENGAAGFGGASSFMLWGGVFLNVARHRTQLDLVEGLVHEAAHQLMFGLAVDEPLVENPIEERYGSPLRNDPRPMDGVFHATFVCARVHYVYERLRAAAASALPESDRRLIEQRLLSQREKFLGGLETVQRFGRMTPTGARVMGAAADYMRSAA
jgi:HEXXH motif-containing protein